MKKMLLAFFCGLLIGFAFPLIHFSSLTPMEESLGQIVYERLSEYQSEIDMDRVLSFAKDFASHKLPLKEEKELYAPLMEMAERKVERDMALILQKTETFLQDVQKRPEVKAIVPDRVFVEILQEGSGEAITANDPIRLCFKEYASDGTLIKDTADKPYTIPLSQTIKGFQLGLAGAKVGETRKLYIHPDYGFGRLGRKAPNKPLIYEVTIVEKKK